MARKIFVEIMRGTKWQSVALFDDAKAARQYGQALANANKVQVRLRDADSPKQSKKTTKKKPRAKMKKNPASRALPPEGEQAAQLFESFTGHKASKAKVVKLPRHKAGLAIGPLLAVAYETTRDGKREKYLHEFRSKSRPTLVASHDGSSLYLLGGAYRFTDRGIVDQ